jgi:thiol-disulfide isomerase/thioredoxin
MRPPVGLMLLFVGIALVATGCKQMQLSRRADASRAESPRALGCGPRVGQMAPEIDGENFDGQRMRLSDQIVLVVFWYSGCIPCMEMVEHERELAQRYRDKPFILLGVNLDDNPETATKTILRKKMTWPVWKNMPADRPILKDWGVTTVPATFVIDQTGIVRYADVRGDKLDDAIESLLANRNHR